MSNRVDNLISYVEKHSKSIDNDSLLYIFDNGYTYAIARELVEAQIPGFHTNTGLFNYYDHILKSVLGSGHVINVLYKNKTGKWIKMLLLRHDNPRSGDIFALANEDTISEKYIAENKIIPQTVFTAKDKQMYLVSERDNSQLFIKKLPVYLDELDQNSLVLSQFSIENPSWGSDMRHMMYDLRIEFKNIVPDNILICLNNVFVEPIRLRNYPNSVFIKNARWLYTTRNLSFKEKSLIKENVYADTPVATAEISDNSFNRHYNINVRIFKWDNVIIEPWMHIKHVNYELEMYEYKNIRIMKSLIFDDELDPSNTIIISDGLILDPSTYEMKGNELILKSVKGEFLSLMSEFKYKHVKNAVQKAADYINDRYYYAVKFKDADSKQKLVLRKTNPVEIGILGFNQVLFDTTVMNDLITVDGAFLPYIIRSNGLVEFPEFDNDYLYFRRDIYPFHERQITRYELVNYYTM